MMNRYLIQAPTVIVIGVAAVATWPSLFPEGEQAQARGTSKPPPMETYSTTPIGLPSRDPFQAEGVIDSHKTQTTKAPPPKETVEVKVEKQPPPRPVSHEDQIVTAMRLGGIYIGGSAPVAIIDDQVYSLGERLRKADGSPLPFVIAQIQKDRAVIRKGREEFTLGFSDDPQMAAPRVPAPAIADAAPSAKPGPVDPKAGASPRPKGPMSRDRPASGGDSASMLLQLLSGLNGSSGGQGGGAGGGSGVNLGMLGGLLGGASGGAMGSAGNTPVNPATLQTGLDALMGKFDNIGQGGPIPDLSGGNNP